MGVSYVQFEWNFIDNGREFRLIKWESGEPEITHLFSELSKNIIVTQAKYKLISEGDVWVFCVSPSSRVHIPFVSISAIN